MHIISGKYKGRSLKFPKTQKLRPISQKVKEALFNILGNNITDCVFLDLFSGTGQVGIEALSRGAKLTYFVDLNIKFIKQNLRELNITDGAVVVRNNALDFIMKSTPRKFDIAFIAPPYEEEELYLSTLKRIDEFDILNVNGLAVFEHEKKIKLPDIRGDLKKIRSAVYGGTTLSFYKA
jgi:16S rRNA (guanine(966)-N(2))-methyltransferase RsmD